MPLPLAIGAVLVAAGVGYAWRRRARRRAQLAPSPPVAQAPARVLPPAASEVPALAPAIAALLEAIDARWPQRGRWSDGLMTPAPVPRTDHDLGNAVDITLDPVSGPKLNALAEVLLGDGRTRYIIWNNQIRWAGDPAWQPYCEGRTSCNPHTRHMHVSVHAAKREDGRPWKVEG